jgi:cytosine/adenosine deaminase-related metal-dependent hydrolase
MKPLSSSHRRLTFINADIGGTAATTLRVVGSRIAALGRPPAPDDVVVDLDGDRLLPGLINAHDHLQLNSLPRLQTGAPYHHVRAWIADVDLRRKTDRTFQASVAVRREQRLLLGGIKNLLSGVTTVAHHDPLYPWLSSESCPIRVVRHYGWSHSLYLDGEERVRRSFRRTSSEWPWIIHAAEGVAAEALREFERLEALGCVGANTLIVHGIALGEVQRARLERAGAGLVWCPSSNLHLFGKTAEVGELVRRGRVALGTDSRLSGARDLLEELKIAGAVGSLDEQALQALVTVDAARLLRLTDRGTLKPGACADLVVLPARMPLSQAARVDLRMVMLEGRVRYADSPYALKADPESRWAAVRVDGVAKVLDEPLAALLSVSSVAEPGLELPGAAWRAA